MGKITPSSLLNDLRGKTGNSVISLNKNGLYIKSFVKPVTSILLQNNNVRLRFSAIAAQWQLLSYSVKLTWNSAGLTYTFTDNIGRTYHPTGYQLFIFINMNIWPMSSAFITTAANYAAVPQTFLVIDEISHSSSSVYVRSTSYNTSGYYTKLMFSKIIPPAPQGYKYPTTYAIGFLGNHAMPYDIGSFVAACLKSPFLQNWYYFMQTINVNVTTGNVSPPVNILQYIY
jgi:hypothetical protein